MTEITVFQSHRDNIATTRFQVETVSSPGPGEVLARVEHFALTANNITYGVAGDSIGYWQFFPAESPWGVIPVWGFAEVVESRCEAVPVGERVYGYLPMATHVRLRPERVGDHGWIDGVEHRQSLPPVYNQYVRTAADPAWRPDREPEQMIYRPLFTTSFFLDDFVAEHDGFGAGSILIVSASSKTAIGLAHLLHTQRADRFRVVGLTSARNADFVRALGCYHDVFAYDRIGDLPQAASMIVDMAGDATVRRNLHGHLGERLVHDCAVGITHWQDAGASAAAVDLPGPAPQMFFAPSQIQKRMQEWGRARYEAQLGAAWEGFLSVCSDWITIERRSGPEALAATYAGFIDGSADPARGFVLSLTG